MQFADFLCIAYTYLASFHEGVHDYELFYHIKRMIMSSTAFLAHDFKITANLTF